MNDIEAMRRLYDKILLNLTEGILPFWLKYAPDETNGGFYGHITRDGKGDVNAPKSLVLNARILWTFSNAYQMLGYSSYINAADRAYHYITTHFIKNDPSFKGGYWLLNADGSVREAIGNMHTYGQSFLLYAFSEYASVTQNTEAYYYARCMYEFIDQHCRSGDVYTELPYQNNAGQYELSMNTHLHIIEAVTCYYRLCKSKDIENRLVSLIELFINKIYNKDTHHLKIYFNSDGDALTDHISYGHDIEFSWLLTEAAEALQIYAINNSRVAESLERCRICSYEIADSVIKEGIDFKSGALYDEADLNGKILHQDKVWWIQAEAVVGFFNAWQICGESRFFDMVNKIYDYIDRYLIDHEFGEWYKCGLDLSPNAKNGYKADEWKCPYHNSRMALEIISRIKN